LCATRRPPLAIFTIPTVDFDGQRPNNGAVQPKTSATILAFVQPLFLKPYGPPPEKFAETLKIAVLVWNAVVLDDHRGTAYLSQTRAQLRFIADPRAREFMLALVDDFADRKRAEFAEHVWLVGDWQVLDQPGTEPRLRVDARHLPPPGDDLQPRSWAERLPEQ
jgi:hypothetical protein